LITRAAAQNKDLDLTMVHADAKTLLGNLAADKADEQVQIYDRLTRRLQNAGAECVVVTSIAGHFCIDPFTEISPLPVIDLTDALSEWLQNAGMKTVGILGTEAVMVSGMYGKLAPVEVLAPKGDALSNVSASYISLATTGVCTSDRQDTFFAAGRDMMERGAEAILLGGTDINLAFENVDCGFPIVDCAGIHVDSIARWT
jgi:aspartate racemase